MFEGKLKGIQNVLSNKKTEMVKHMKDSQEAREEQKEQLVKIENEIKTVTENFIGNLSEKEFNSVVKLIFDSYKVWGEEYKFTIETIFVNKLTTLDTINYKLNAYREKQGNCTNDRQVLEFGLGILKDYFSKIHELGDIDSIWNNSYLIGTSMADRTYKYFEEVVIDRNYNRVLNSYGHFSDIKNFIAKTGIENFYNEDNILFIAKELNPNNWRKYLKKVDRESIEFTRASIYEQLTKQLNPTTQYSVTLLLIDDKNNVTAQPTSIWINNNILYICHDGYKWITAKQHCDEIFTTIDMADIDYFKTLGEVYTEQKISTKNKLNIGSKSKDIQLDLVTHDTRKVILQTLRSTNSKYFSFDNLEVFRKLIPDKEYKE